MLKIGQKIRISPDFIWARSEIGVVSYPPSTLIEYDELGYARTVSCVEGPVLYYYIEFETPQFDSDGDGPYRGAEIPEKYLTPIM